MPQRIILACSIYPLNTGHVHRYLLWVLLSIGQNETFDLALATCYCGLLIQRTRVIKRVIVYESTYITNNYRDHFHWWGKQY